MIGPQCHENGVCGYGEPGQIMFIGIAPGQDEWLTSRKPFTGPSGYVLTQVLKAVGIDRDAQCYCTNLICWWKDTPDKLDIQECSSRLQAEIQLVNPKIIVTLGKLACEAIIGLPFSKARGAVIQRNDPNRDGRYYLATYHPAASLHKGETATEKELQINAAYDLCRDLSKLPRIIDGLYKWIEPKYTIVSSLSEAQTMLDSLPKDRPVALDIETNYDKEAEESHPLEQAITCIGIGYEDSHCYILVGDAISPQLQWPDLEYTYHNGVFDTVAIRRKLGVWLPIKRDTMLESGSCDERSIRGLHKLKPAQREWLGCDFYEEEEHKADQEALLQYNAKDVCGTVRLDRYYTDWMQREGTEEAYRQILLPAAEMLARAQFRGIHVDKAAMLRVVNEFEPEYHSIQAQLNQFAKDILGFPEYNVNSHRQTKMILQFQGYNIPNTRKETLDDLLDREDIPFVRLVRRYRTYDKLLRKDMRGVLREIKYDGRVHPNAYQLGTVTGRLSINKPSMNTLPKPKTVKDLGIIRSIFSATNEDYVILEADYAQIEGWIGAFFSEDDKLWAALESGDWHTATTVEMFGKTAADVSVWEWASLRDAGKHINYGIFFDESAWGLTRRPPTGIGCDLATAQGYLRKWKSVYVDFVRYALKQKQLAKTEGCLTTPFGRKRRFPMVVNDHQLRQAVNYRIQSTASDYSFSSAIRLRPQLEQLDTHLLFIEHDALYYEVNRRHLEEALGLVRQEMERPPLPSLPSIKIEMDLGPNLAELERVV